MIQFSVNLFDPSLEEILVFDHKLQCYQCYNIIVTRPAVPKIDYYVERQ